MVVKILILRILIFLIALKIVFELINFCNLKILMQIRKNKRQFTIQFQSAGQVSNDVQKEQETQIINNFIYPIQGFQFFAVQNTDLDKIKKKLIAFTIQYGPRNQKTTSIFLNYLQNTREVGLSYLKNKDIIKASSLFADSLSFVDPQYDEVFLQKFTNIKIDVINKLMYCVFELESWERNQSQYDVRRLDFGLKLMIDFITRIKQFSFYSNLLKSESCLLEVTYFYFGRLYRKKKKIKKAEEQFRTALQIIREKIELKTYSKNQNLQVFLQNLMVKIYYKLSKCYRQDKSEKSQQTQFEYQKLALTRAKQINQPLFVYLNRKIRFYRKKKVFQSKLTKIDGRKRIEEEITKIIEECKQTEIQSLYDVYLDQLDQQS